MTTHTIKSGEIVIFETKKGIEFATQPKNRRKSMSGEDGLNVVSVPYDNLRAFIEKLTDIESERKFEKVILLHEGRELPTNQQQY